MDILIHALSGTAVSTCIVACVDTTARRKIGIVLAGTLGAAFSDIDAISMWSHFDAVFGRLFGLQHRGSVIYGAKFWYSHHAFFHSLVAGLLFGLLFVGLILLISKQRKEKDTLRFSGILFLAFIFGYWAHLLGDLPTPASVWGGVNLFWPAKNYVGGFGNIWWWNNYDIFLILVLCIFFNLLILFVRKFIRFNVKILTCMLLAVALICIVMQVNNRKLDYAYIGNAKNYSELEQHSKQEQQRILGKKLYRFMERFDQLMPFNF